MPEKGARCNRPFANRILEINCLKDVHGAGAVRVPLSEEPEKSVCCTRPFAQKTYHLSTKCLCLKDVHRTGPIRVTGSLGAPESGALRTLKSDILEEDVTTYLECLARYLANQRSRKVLQVTQKKCEEVKGTSGTYLKKM